MTELKTLKELSYGLNRIPDSHTVPKELRDEAKKWVEELQAEIEEHAYQSGDCSCEKHHNDLGCEIRREKIAWIKHFFNLEDEQ